MTQPKKITTTPEQQEEMIAAVREVLETKYPYLLDIMEEVRKFPNGVVNLSLRVYNGVVQDIVGTDVWRKSYSSKPKQE